MLVPGVVPFVSGRFLRPVNIEGYNLILSCKLIGIFL